MNADVDPRREPEKVKTICASLGTDERRHADLTQETIDIVTNAR